MPGETAPSSTNEELITMPEHLQPQPEANPSLRSIITMPEHLEVASIDEAPVAPMQLIDGVPGMEKPAEQAATNDTVPVPPTQRALGTPQGMVRAPQVGVSRPAPEAGPNIIDGVPHS